MTTRDDATLRRYREASAKLDERPSDATRAAILAAAARGVNARPVSTDAPRPAMRKRWPLAAAATVLLSTLAALVATRTEQEMPVFQAPADRAEEQIAAAPLPRKPGSPAADAASGALQRHVDIAPAQRPQLNVPSANAPAAAPASQVPAKPDSGRLAATDASPANAAQAPAVDAKLNKSIGERSERDTQAAQGASKPAEAVVPPHAAPEAPLRAKSRSAGEPAVGEIETRSGDSARRAFPGAASGTLETAPPTAAPLPAPSVAPTPAPRAPAASSSDAAAGRDAPDSAASAEGAKRERFGSDGARQDAAPERAVRQLPVPKHYERSADAWLEHIVQLRRDGRHDEADAELKRLRERYPDVRVPPAALPSTGTR